MLNHSDVAPVAVSERIAALDILRGLSLFGVLQINLLFYSGMIYRLWAGMDHPLGLGGQFVAWLRDSFLGGKSILCFSMLFGLGLCLQMERALAKGHGFSGFALRRLGALALIGAVHGILIWPGDILFGYAVVGLALLPLLRARVRTILIAMGAAFVLTANWRLIFKALHAPAELFFGHWAKQAAWILQSVNRAYGQGTWAEAFWWRQWEWSHVEKSILLLSGFEVLPLFLLGLALWRSEKSNRGPADSPADLPLRVLDWVGAGGYSRGLGDALLQDPWIQVDSAP